MFERLRWLCLAMFFVTLASCGGGGGGGDSSSSSSPEGTPLPLIGEAPPGLTAEDLEQLLPLSDEGLGLDFVTNAPVAPPSEILIRPGTLILPESIFPGWCTAAFVFDGRSKIATAGHCMRKGDRIIALSAPSSLFVIGTTASSVSGDVGNDWALISIDPAWQSLTSPSVALVGGPCGKVTSGDAPLPVIKYVGHGAAVGAGGTARGGVLLGSDGPEFNAAGIATDGDSGAPVLEALSTEGCASGRAVGILTHTLVLAGAVPTGIFAGTPIEKVPGVLTDGGLP